MISNCTETSASVSDVFMEPLLHHIFLKCGSLVLLNSCLPMRSWSCYLNPQKLHVWAKTVLYFSSLYFRLNQMHKTKISLKAFTSYWLKNNEIPPNLLNLWTVSRPSSDFLKASVLNQSVNTREPTPSLCVTVPPVIVKEWSSGKAKSALTPELVPALCFREWTCPNLRRLWLGRASEDRSRRTRAFLACLRSDCPALLNPAQVPQHLLLMCCVLRYDGALHLSSVKGTRTLKICIWVSDK